MAFTIAALALASCSQAEAQEDLRATYATGASSMVLEIQSDGDLRGTIDGNELDFLKLDGKNYFIFLDGDRQDVLDVAVAAQLFDEAIPPELRAMIAQAPTDDMMQVEPAGSETVNGREGTAYRLAGAPEVMPAPFVISSDPELALLRDATLAQFRTSVAMNPMAPEGAMSSVLEILEQGAPIRFAGSDLVEVERVELDDGAFVLPAEPMDKDESLAFMIERGMLPEGGRIEMPELPPVNDQ